ncbi:hypothetical protein B6F84_03080 [Acidianus manzaensis]|uniref:Uncharacterized protein n=1 Tax=Acidianus manzaensis TaxID=282676 RepID=A0A1W6K3B9_9CREN|nr:hypothetical protein B6F84_03080 [Acidianus manzaensis]
MTDLSSSDLLIILDGVEKISLINRGEIFNFFFNRLRNTKEFREYVLENRKYPKINGIIISPIEISYNNPKVLYMILNGYILYDPQNLLQEKRKEIKENKIKIVNYKHDKLIDLGKVKKGEVIDL